MNQAIIHEGHYVVTSYGNGLSYLIVDAGRQEELFLQGDDATEFRNEWEGWEREFPNTLIDDIIGGLTGEMPYQPIKERT